MATSTAQVGNLSITTQVVPAGANNVPGLASISSPPNWAQVLAQKKKRPIKSLSAVTILIGALQLCVGVSMYLAEMNYPSLLSRSGAAIWGGLGFIISGVITVILCNEENIVQIKTCLISHLVNATFAAVGMVVYAIQLYVDSQSCWVAVSEEPRYNRCVPKNSNSSTSSPYDDDYRHRYYYWDYSSFIYTLRVALNSLVLFYVIVGFAISVCIMLLRWKSLKAARYTLLGN